MSYTQITNDEELRVFCDRHSRAKQIALDTEFVAEHTYRPVLCLVQVAADEELALIDPLTIKDMLPFWVLLAKEGHETVVHAGRGEVEFCLHAVGRPPANLFDVQTGAGLVGIEYPAGYGNLITKLLGKKPNKEETRTDWRRRPLSALQIEYALDDIRFLPAIREVIGARLEDLGRVEWLQEEMASWLEEIQQAVSSERWRRVSGNSGLSARSLGIVRELWRWRESEAERRNCPVRRVLRDDLIVELARRQTADLKRIRALRGLERGDLQRQLHRLSAAIQRGLELPEGELPTAARVECGPQLSVLGQFLFAALGNICRQASLSPGLVGGPNDVRELIAYRAGQASARRPPRLAKGWRAGVIGRVFDDLLAGKIVVRVVDPASDSPLALEPGRS